MQKVLGSARGSSHCGKALETKSERIETTQTRVRERSQGAANCRENVNQSQGNRVTF